MDVCTSGRARQRIGDISFVWGDGPESVAAVMAVSATGEAACWMNRRAVVGIECYWVMRWARHAVAAGWRFATVRTEQLAALRVA